MAWDHDPDLIFSVGCCNRAHSFFIADIPAQFEIGNSFSEWDLQQFTPDFLLKESSLLVHGNVKTFSFATEKFYQLLRALMHYLANARFAMYHLLWPVDKTQLSNVMFSPSYLDQSDGTLVICVVEICQYVNNEL